jgi:hypothetical protein
MRLPEMMTSYNDSRWTNRLSRPESYCDPAGCFCPCRIAQRLALFPGRPVPTRDRVSSARVAWRWVQARLVRHAAALGGEHGVEDFQDAVVGLVAAVGLFVPS